MLSTNRHCLRKSSTSLAARKDHAVLLRKYVSRNSAGKGRAVLEYLEFDTVSIEMCYANNPRNEEEAVQCGLLKWTGSHDATWKVLVGAMGQAGIAVQYIDKLKEELQKGAHTRMCLIYACVHVALVRCHGDNNPTTT